MVSFHYSYSLTSGIRLCLVHPSAALPVRAALGWTRRSLIPLGSLSRGEFLLQRADEFTQRFPVRRLPPDEDKEAAAVEEYRAGDRLPTLHHVQRDGGRGQLVEGGVEL